MEKEPTVNIRGAMGFWHSVPVSQVEQFRKEQQELEDSGELRRRLEARADEIAARFPAESFKRGR